MLNSSLLFTLSVLNNNNQCTLTTFDSIENCQKYNNVGHENCSKPQTTLRT